VPSDLPPFFLSFCRGCSAQSHDQKTFLAGTIARALAVFCVDEVVIFDDGTTPDKNRLTNDLVTDEYTAFSDPSHFLAHLLAYVETPPYLRKQLFPVHSNLRTAGTLPSLDMPHHLRANEWCDYREGVVVSWDNEQGLANGGQSGDVTQKKKNTMTRKGKVVDPTVKKPTLIDTGLQQKIGLADYDIPLNTRVTIKFKSRKDPEEGAEPVDPTAPRVEAGYYWGYNVRRCASLSAVFTECPFDGGYDLSFGTSERGTPISNILVGQESIWEYNHLLVVFGGVAGIEAAIASDQELLDKGLTPKEAAKLFDYCVNLIPGQGSRTIRTEEAVWLGLMGLRCLLEKNGR
jgi:methyltransferase